MPTTNLISVAALAGLKGCGKSCVLKAIRDGELVPSVAVCSLNGFVVAYGFSTSDHASWRPKSVGWQKGKRRKREGS